MSVPWLRREVIGDAVLYLGDCLAILPHLPKMDAVITDPVWPTVPMGALPGWENPGDLLRRMFDCIDPLRAVVVLGFDCDPRFLTAIPDRLPFIRSQQLPYAVPGYRGRLLGGDEIAYAFGAIPKGHGVIPGRAPTEVSAKSARVTGHPCPRSDMHMLSLVGWWSEPQEIVCDPFLGTGATAIACIQASRQFIGIEIHEPYFDIACSRIENAQRQGKLFVDEPQQKPEQLTL